MRPLKMLLRLCVLLGVAFLARAEGPPPEPRTALIIGNSAYSFAPLKNPINDAEAMASALEGAGFRVIKETDADQAKMVEAVRTFGAELKRRGGVGLFYFSGHGTQIDGENYLLPVGEQFASLEDVKRRSVTALAVVEAMASAHSDLNIFILDACRNNPIDPNGAKGLSRIDSNARLFISYATSPGLTALDGEGNNSPYAKYLYQSIDAPNLDIEDTFKRTLKGVYVETHGEQTPWIASTFFGDFVFRPSGEPPAAGEEKAPAETAEPEEAAPKTIDLAGVYRVEGTNPNGSKYQGMVALAQNNDQFNFTWWIGKDVFRGTGHFAGKMLVVNWGDKTPVIYTFGDEGALDGEWADGSATETLDLVANAAPGDIGLSEGSYRVDGKNADGSGYQGNVEITGQGKAYHLTWQVGSSSYEGDGKLAGNLLTVDWGSSTPVVYALKPDGSLAGLWDAGKGEETLTPEE
ncbi:MAG: caspase family protein [Methyloceanibacter sp.]